MTINDAYLIKGWLYGANPPPEIRNAMDAVIDSLVGTREQIAATVTRPLPLPTPPVPVAVDKPAEPPLMEPKPRSTPAGPPPTRKNSLRKIDDADLPAIMKQIEAGVTRTSIGEPYGVTGQTVANFLKRHGVAAPRDRGPRPEPVRGDEPDDPEPVATRPAPAPAGAAPPVPPRPEADSAWAGVRCDDALRPGDLVDIHEMLGAGETTAEIAGRYNVPKAELEAFILRHPNVAITRCAPGYAHGGNSDTTTRPSARSR